MQVVKKDMHTKFKCQFFLDCERLIYKIIYNWVKISTYIFLVSQGIFFYSFKLVMKLNELIFQYCLKIKKIKINPSEKIDARTLQNLYLFKFCEIRIPFLDLYNFEQNLCKNFRVSTTARAKIGVKNYTKNSTNVSFCKRIEIFFLPAWWYFFRLS